MYLQKLIHKDQEHIILLLDTYHNLVKIMNGKFPRRMI
jgi:predicted 2-oxoglutarate/Fe(II)-dependent dioxygenase YbiX